MNCWKNKARNGKLGDLGNKLKKRTIKIHQNYRQRHLLGQKLHVPANTEVAPTVLFCLSFLSRPKQWASTLFHLTNSTLIFNSKFHLSLWNPEMKEPEEKAAVYYFILHQSRSCLSKISLLNYSAVQPLMIVGRSTIRNNNVLVVGWLTNRQNSCWWIR